MSPKLLTIATIATALLFANSASAAVFDRQDASNRAERMNRDHMLHKRFYQTERSRDQNRHKKEPQSQHPGAGDRLEDRERLLHPSRFDSPRLLIDI